MADSEYLASIFRLTGVNFRLAAETLAATLPPRYPLFRNWRSRNDLHTLSPSPLGAAGGKVPAPGSARPNRIANNKQTTGKTAA
jgi:hypothetical protein